MKNLRVDYIWGFLATIQLKKNYIFFNAVKKSKD